MRAETPAGEERYVCKREQKLPKSEQTVFILEDLNLDAEAYLEDIMGSGFNPEDGTMKISLGTQTLVPVQLGLKAVENLPGIDELEPDPQARTLPGGKRPWKTEGPNSLKMIPKWARREIAGRIINRTRMTEDERKNS